MWIKAGHETQWKQLRLARLDTVTRPTSLCFWLVAVTAVVENAKGAT